MEFTFNGNIPDYIFFNNNELEYLSCNNVIVWKKPDMLTKPLYFISSGVSTIAMDKIGSNAPNVDMKYSLDRGNTWVQWDLNPISLTDGQTVWFKGLNTTFTNNVFSNYVKFTMTGSLVCRGNIMSIIDDGACNTTTIPAANCFGYLFYGCTALKSAPLLPATVLKDQCYIGMFRGCTSLIDPPALPATTLAYNCYANMFRNCSSLIRAPYLGATVLPTYCYSNMFVGCVSLVEVQEKLPATQLSSSCYRYMFSECTSLTTAPELPAPILVEYCYDHMFNRCTNLNYIKCLATNISATDCTSGWVTNVAPTGTFVKDSSMNDWTIGVNGIPTGWVVQNVVVYKGLKFTATGNSTISFKQSSEQYPVYPDIKYSMDEGETWIRITNYSAVLTIADGKTICFKGNNPNRFSYYDTTFGYNRAIQFVMTGSLAASGNIMSLIDDGACTTKVIPNVGCFYELFYDCESLTTPPELPATTIKAQCYEFMFWRCRNLTTTPKLPATTLYYKCYKNMFDLCTSLTTAPELPAPILEEWCYYEMFEYCENMNYIKCLATDISATNCTSGWVSGVAATGTFVISSGASWSRGASGIPTGWTIQSAT